MTLSLDLKGQQHTVFVTKLKKLGSYCGKPNSSSSSNAVDLYPVPTTNVKVDWCFACTQWFAVRNHDQRPLFN